jgi:hypothetical protein
LRKRLFITCSFGLLPPPSSQLWNLPTLTDADGQPARGAERGVRESAPAELGERHHGRFVDQRGGDFDSAFEPFGIGK